MNFYIVNKPVIHFFLKAFLLYLLWFLIYDLYLRENGLADSWLTNNVTNHSISILRLLRFDATHTFGFNTYHQVSIENIKMLGISNACNGQVLYPLFAGFIIATPGFWKNKLVMIITGFVSIYIVNILRIVLLIIIRYYKPEYLAFNHKYTFVILVYSFIFFLWILWVNKFSKLKFD